MNNYNVRSALITGASSGIGAAFACELAAQGYDLVLVARREAKLAQLAAELQQQFHVHIEVLVADLSQFSDVARVEGRIAQLPALELLVNNAGFGIPGKFINVPLDRTLAMIDLHVLATTRLTHAALPEMIASGKGGIINVSSIGAFIPRPEDAVYCATKAYLVAFTRGLKGELQGSGIHVQALCPGFVPTEFLDTPEYVKCPVKGRIPPALWMPAEEVVTASLNALRRGQVISIPGFKNRVIVVLGRSGLSNFLLGSLRSRLDRSLTVKVTTA